MESQRLCQAVLAKIQEQIVGTLHLISLLPPDSLDWSPAIPGAWTVGFLLGHLLDVLAGFCAVLAAARPAGLRIPMSSENYPSTTPAYPTKPSAGSPTIAPI